MEEDANHRKESGTGNLAGYEDGERSHQVKVTKAALDSEKQTFSSHQSLESSCCAADISPVDLLQTSEFRDPQDINIQFIIL